jgi:hypothetical protein
MSPPTDKPRLDKIDPAALARETEERVLQRLASLLFPLGRTAAEMGPSDLTYSLQALCLYAQTGRDGETDDPAVAGSYARDRMLSICTTLYSTLGGDDWAPNPVYQLDRPLDTDLDVVLVAAWARTRASNAELDALTSRELAALGSCSPEHVRLLARQGELRRAGEEAYSLEEANRWLGARGTAPVWQWSPPE